MVNVGETTVTLPFVGMYLPPAGHPVQIESRGGAVVVTGPARPLPGSGVIVTVATLTATVLGGDGVTYTLPYRVGYEPSSGHNVEISWSADGGVIQGEVSAVSDDPPPVTNPGGGPVEFHPQPFIAIDSGSFDSRWSTASVYSSASKDGAWFYGSLSDTIPADATITLARIYLSVASLNVNAPGNLTVHTSPTKPAGNVAWTGLTVPVAPRTGWVDIPSAFIDYLKVNPGGLGFNQGGYTIYKATNGADRMSGALDIAWTI